MDNTQTMNVTHDIVIKKYAKLMPDEKVNFFRENDHGNDTIPK